MALAYLRYAGSDGSSSRFQVDLGRNRYYTYSIGDAETDLRNGIRVLRNRTHTSRLFGPLDDESLGRADVEVPNDLFDRTHDAIQLISFRSRERAGPAVSSIIRVSPADYDEESLPPISLSQSVRRDGHVMAIDFPPRTVRPARSRARIHERTPHGQYSQAQFLEVLGSLLPSILPMAGNLLGSLFGGSSGAAAPAAASGAAPTIPPELQQLLQQLLNQLGTPAKAPAPVSTPPATPAVVKTASRYTRLAYARSTNGHAAYSEAMVLPLLAALPALMPLLQQVLTPQTVQSILQTADPNKLIGTISNAVQGVAQLGLAANQQQLDHLRALNPGIDNIDLGSLLASMSTNLAVQPRALKYRRVSSVKLHFADIATISLSGRQMATYVRGRDLQFPLALESARPLPPGLVQIVIKDATTLEFIAEARLRTPPLNQGRMPVTCTVPADQLSKLNIGEDYLACAHLAWKTSSGEKVGTTITQLFTVLGDYTFDSVDESNGELIPLNDVDKFRDFWHKVWQDSFTRDLARTEFEVKYYYLLQPAQTENAQVDTSVAELEKGLRRSVSRLKSGLLLSPNRLNELLPRISSNPLLPEDQLAALLSPAFTKRLHLAARKRVKFAGRPGTTAALWVFPEVKVQRLRLVKADQVAPTGNVITVVPVQVSFPIPALAHFVGVSSE